jgi:quinoprotein relay system zinc metallohydrolase 1
MMAAPSRRQLLAAMAAAPLVAAAPPEYVLAAQALAPGVWVVRGQDAAIAMANGGAIANIGVIATDAGAVLIDAGPSRRYGQALASLARRLVPSGPVARLYITHLHPDHSFGAAAFDPAITAATRPVAAQVAGDAAGFSAGLYRLLGDWMRGTEVPEPALVAEPGVVTIGGRRLNLMVMDGHSGSDLAVLDEASGTLFAGDLVFNDRAPSTPHADLARWRTSLAALACLGQRRLVPGHGPVDESGTAAIAQTLDWLDWMAGAISAAMDAGMTMVEAGAMPIPARFAGLKMARYELQRSVSHQWARLERARLPLVSTSG